jgi:membrane fusion protein (multidrug efflux system)
LLLPQAAVTDLQGVNQVAVVGGDNKVRIQNVQIGSQVGADWIVNQGLEVGAHVVVGGIQFARQGATVNPMLVAATKGAR